MIAENDEYRSRFVTCATKMLYEAKLAVLAQQLNKPGNVQTSLKSYKEWNSIINFPEYNDAKVRLSKSLLNNLDMIKAEIESFEQNPENVNFKDIYQHIENSLNLLTGLVGKG